MYNLSVLTLLERALDPADQAMAASAGADLHRKFGRRRYRVVVACLDEMTAESRYFFTDWRSNAASKNDYSRPYAPMAYLQIRSALIAIRALSFTALCLGLPSANPLRYASLFAPLRRAGSAA